LTGAIKGCSLFFLLFISIAVENGMIVGGCIYKVSFTKLSSKIFFAIDVTGLTFPGDSVFVYNKK
jgi:hypothetical protein